MDTKTPKSQLEWQADYDKRKMRVTGVKHSIAEREQWKIAATTHNVKLAMFVRLCVKYCIDNNIDLKDINL